MYSARAIHRKHSYGIIISLYALSQLFPVIFFSHIYVKAPKFQLRSTLKMSDCYIRNFNFGPMLTLHVRIHTLLRVEIMLKFK